MENCAGFVRIYKGSEKAEMFDIEPYLPEIKNICQKYDAKSLTLFGSALTDEFDPATSDCDFLLELNGYKKGIFRYISIKKELEQLLQRDVDLVSPRNIENPLLKKYIYAKTRTCYAT